MTYAEAHKMLQRMEEHGTEYETTETLADLFSTALKAIYDIRSMEKEVERMKAHVEFLEKERKILWKWHDENGKA